jgi:transcriptional regulator with XRE-family HTH domain
MESLVNFGRDVLKKREEEGLGLRAAAKKIGITHATLSRVEKGFHPDLATYQKISNWLKGTSTVALPVEDASAPQVHFRREKTVSPEMAHSLAQMILHAQKAWGLSRSASEPSE